MEMQDQTENIWNLAFREDMSTDQSTKQDLLNESCGSCTSTTFRDTQKDGRCLSDMLKAFQKAMKSGKAKTDDDLKKTEKKVAEFEELLKNIEAQRLKQLELEDAMKKSADPELELKKEQEKKEKEERKIRVQKEFEERQAKLRIMLEAEKERQDPKNQLMKYFKEKGELGSKPELDQADQTAKMKSESLSQLPSVTNLTVNNDPTPKAKGTFYIQKESTTQDSSKIQKNQVKISVTNKSMQGKSGPQQKSLTPKYSQSNATSLLEIPQASTVAQKIVIPKSADDKQIGQKVKTIQDVAEVNNYHLPKGSPVLRPDPAHKNIAADVSQQKEKQTLNTSAHIAVKKPQVDMSNYSSSPDMKAKDSKIMQTKLQPNSPVLMAIQQSDSPVKQQKVKFQQSLTEKPSLMITSNSMNQSSIIRKKPEQAQATVESMMMVTNFKPGIKPTDQLTQSRTEFRISKRNTDDNNRGIGNKIATPVIAKHQASEGFFTGSINKTVGESENPIKEQVSPPRGTRTTAKPHRNNVIEYHLTEMKRSLTREHRNAEPVTQIRGSQTTKHQSSSNNVADSNGFRSNTAHSRSAKQAPPAQENLTKQSYTNLRQSPAPIYLNQTSANFRQPSGREKQNGHILELNGLAISSLQKERKPHGFSHSNSNQSHKRLKARQTRVEGRHMDREQQTMDMKSMTKEGFFYNHSNSLPQKRDMHSNFNPSLTAKGFNAAKVNIDNIYRQATTTMTGNQSKPDFREKVDIRGFWDANLKESSSPPKGQRLKAITRKKRSKITKDDLIQEIYLIK